MKWFKHMTNARSDSALGALRQEFGSVVAYGRWMMILEIVAGGTQDESFTVTHRRQTWCGELAIKPRQLRRFLQAAQDLGLVSFKESGDQLTISVPELASITDEYWRKSRQRRDRGPDKVRTVEENRTEERRKKRRREDMYAPPAPEGGFSLSELTHAGWRVEEAEVDDVDAV